MFSLSSQCRTLAFCDSAVQFPHFRQDEQCHNNSRADVCAGTCIKQTIQAEEQRQDQQQGNQQDELTQHGKQRSFQRLTCCLEIVGGNDLEAGTENTAQINPQTAYSKVCKCLIFFPEQAQHQMRRQLAYSP